MYCGSPKLFLFWKAVMALLLSAFITSCNLDSGSDGSVVYSPVLAAGAAVSEPVVSGTPTHNSITVTSNFTAGNPGLQTIEFARSLESDGTGLSAWQDSGTFTWLNPTTTYFFYARSKANTTHAAGTQSLVSAAIATDTAPLPYWDAFTPPVIGMVLITGGTFTMGDANTLSWGAQPPHTVTVSSFNMGKYQITQAQWVAVMGTNPSWFRPGGGGSAAVSGINTFNFPVDSVSWYDVLVFANRLSILTLNRTPAYEMETPTAGIWSTNPDLWGPVPIVSDARWNNVRVVAGSTGYRLPTEAQWEFACRAGTTTLFNTGDTITQSQANFWVSGGTSLGRTTAVGSYAPNAWGLYDMHGNVWEWVWDWFGVYTNAPKTNPIGPASGVHRVLRGGSWSIGAENLRSAGRGSSNPSRRWWNGSGFRLVRPE